MLHALLYLGAFLTSFAGIGFCCAGVMILGHTLRPNAPERRLDTILWLAALILGYCLLTTSFAVMRIVG